MCEEIIIIYHHRRFAFETVVSTSSYNYTCNRYKFVVLPEYLCYSIFVIDRPNLEKMFRERLINKEEIEI